MDNITRRRSYSFASVGDDYERLAIYSGSRPSYGNHVGGRRTAADLDNMTDYRTAEEKIRYGCSGSSARDQIYSDSRLYNETYLQWSQLLGKDEAPILSSDQSNQPREVHRTSWNIPCSLTRHQMHPSHALQQFPRQAQPKAQIYDTPSHDLQQFPHRMQPNADIYETPSDSMPRQCHGRSRSRQPALPSLADFLQVNTVRPVMAEGCYRDSTDSYDGRQTRMQRMVNPASSELVHKRGKERFEPKKKLSALKKVILRERAEKKEIFPSECGAQNEAEEENEGFNDSAPPGSQNNFSLDSVSQQMADLSLADGPTSLDATSAQPSSLISGSQGSSESGNGSMEKKPTTYIGPDVQIRYCNQVISTELNGVTMELLKELIRFQERAKARDPLKAKSKRRLVVGLREVFRAVRSERAKCIIVAPNIEEITSEGGLDFTLQNILEKADATKTEIVFALTRSRIAQAFGRRVRMSTVAICDFDGANDLYKEMLRLASLGRQQWIELHGQKKIGLPTEL